MAHYEIQHRSNGGYDTILAIKDGVVWADWMTAGNDEHMVAFRTAASDDDVADWGCWDNPQTIDAGENPDPDDWGTLVSRVSAS